MKRETLPNRRTGKTIASLTRDGAGRPAGILGAVLAAIAFEEAQP
ncbi:hypothetical protein [Methylocystis sp.]|nr:hypothetical protein [Methylocystis sp.]